MPECSLRRLYQAIQRRIAVRASARVRNRRRSTNSTLSVAEVALRDALSRHDPVRPIDERAPTRRHACANAVDVYSFTSVRYGEQLAELSAAPFIHSG